MQRVLSVFLRRTTSDHSFSRGARQLYLCSPRILAGIAEVGTSNPRYTYDTRDKPTLRMITRTNRAAMLQGQTRPSPFPFRAARRMSASRALKRHVRS